MYINIGLEVQHKVCKEGLGVLLKGFYFVPIQANNASSSKVREYKAEVILIVSRD